MLAGTGLGITNTPVTNTTTGSVSSDRAGMASGIDMSARMVSLAVNIALMGFILASGVLASLKSALPDMAAADLRALAERVAAGSPVAVPGLSETDVHRALTTGFEWTLLYGGTAVWVLAALSFLISNTGRAGQPAVHCSE
ncbi:MFS transporter [Roseixanthobacter liquoris]|uniref:hypothetical protein n=1 Tax=Roseixanthobacter liquoris TaxID=3119921 RepID=UPI0037271405